MFEKMVADLTNSVLDDVVAPRAELILDQIAVAIERQQGRLVAQAEQLRADGAVLESVLCDRQADLLDTWMPMLDELKKSIPAAITSTSADDVSVGEIVASKVPTEVREDGFRWEVSSGGGTPRGPGHT